MSGPSFACGTCGATLTFTGVRTATCPFCASANVLPRAPQEPGASPRVEPAFTIAFAGDALAASATLHAWLGTRSIFTDRALRRASVEDLRAIYVPAYLYSAVTRATYTALIGEHYSESESYTVLVPDDGGDQELGIPSFERPERPDLRGPLRPPRPRTKPEVRQRTVTRVEQHPLRGRYAAYVNDVLVSASVGLAHHELARLGPFELGELRRYSPALVAGFLQEEFSRDASACLQACRATAEEQMGERLVRFMPGDTQLRLDHAAQLQWESLDPLLVPVWVFAVRYREDRPPLRVLINGQTHAVIGRPPLVWWKLLIVILALAALAVAVWSGVR